MRERGPIEAPGMPGGPTIFFQHLADLYRDTKGFQPLDLCIARAGRRGGWNVGILGSWEAGPGDAYSITSSATHC
jgi:hypothetical protein